MELMLSQRAERNVGKSSRIKACTHIHLPLYFRTLTFNDNLKIYGMVFHSNLSSSNKSYSAYEGRAFDDHFCGPALMSIPFFAH